jgi:mannose-1-phosphate guanylyltransferase/mannose-6-phosphate isomerase
MNIIPVILCGGEGERLWPLSRKTFPKQFLSFSRPNTLFQETAKRFLDIPPVVICNGDHQFIVQNQLEGASIKADVIILEPERCNTAPAIYSSIHYIKSKYSNSIAVVMPSDHFINDNELFLKTVEEALKVAQWGDIVTLGIKPRCPETGFGYIQKGLPLDGIVEGYKVSQFTEKPCLEMAQNYVASGQYYWNSGVFVIPVDVFAKELKDDFLWKQCEKSVDEGRHDGNILRLKKSLYQSVENISFDYAFMEKTNRAAVVEALFEWSDLGSYEALWHSQNGDEAGNVLVGPVVQESAKDCYVYSQGVLTAAVGVDNLAIISTSDAVLVTSKKDSQQIKGLVERLKQEKRPEIFEPSLMHRPWGTYQTIDHGMGYKVKRIIINPGASLSLQKHKHRSEHWVVIQGVATVTHGENVMKLHVNESTYIPVGVVHRLANKTQEVLAIIEVQCGAYLEEDDIERLEDVYEREQYASN